jgi:hypothetical protein
MAKGLDTPDEADDGEKRDVHGGDPPQDRVPGPPGRLVEPAAAGKPLHEGSPGGAQRRKRMIDTEHIRIIGALIAVL